MDIYVLDSTAQILDTIDNFKSIIWTVQYFNVGEFELIVPVTEKNIALLQKIDYFAGTKIATEIYGGML